MNTFRTLFIFSVFIVELVLSFSVHFSKDDLDEEYGKLDMEMEDIGAENYTQALRKRVVIARLEKKKELAAKENELGAVNRDKEQQQIPLKMLGFRSRLEQLADELWPGSRPFDVGIRAAFNEFLFSSDPQFVNSPRIISFRSMVQNSKLGPQELLNTVGDLQSLFSKQAAHPGGLFLPIPLWNDTNGIENMFKSFGIIPDTAKVSAAELLLKAFPLPSKSTPPPVKALSSQKPTFYTKMYISFSTKSTSFSKKSTLYYKNFKNKKFKNRKFKNRKS